MVSLYAFSWDFWIGTENQWNIKGVDYYIGDDQEQAYAKFKKTERYRDLLIFAPYAHATLQEQTDLALDQLITIQPLTRVQELPILNDEDAQRYQLKAKPVMADFGETLEIIIEEKA